MLPNKYLEKMKMRLGDEFDSFIAAYNEPPSVGVRVNTLKLAPDEFSLISPYPLTRIPWTNAGFSLPVDTRPGKHPYHAAGLYYIQDPSAMAVTELLDPKPGERILDLAAAPGGKSTHIAAKMEGQGLLIVNDIHQRRVLELAKNLELWGARNVIILNEPPKKLVDHFGATFDRVLLDAPCSGEGMFRKDRTACNEWTPKFVESCAFRQDGIIHMASELVRPGGRLVYATCTFSPEENEGTVLRFLNSHPDYSLVQPDHCEGFTPGHPDWCSDIDDSMINADLVHTIRLWPHSSAGEGHFIAVMERNEDVPVSSPPRDFQPPPIPGEQISYFQAFKESTFHWKVSHQRLALMGSYLYQLPVDIPDLRGLRVIHWGWWLGSMKVKRFEPSHALAMALTPSDFKQVILLTAEDERTMRYLHGDVVPSQGPDGWVLVSVDGYPLGWGKRVRNRIKSHSPKWLRWI
jgi:16S rRNA C967 or C1407 C5-methylase (RsmB/RsmF family)/NOL1/NOP2/fmu family ribosome biogenesis protein